MQITTNPRHRRKTKTKVIMKVFKVVDEIPDSREFYYERKFDEKLTILSREDCENSRVHKCETKYYQRILFKYDGGVINVVAGDEVSDKFFRSYIEYERLLRERVGVAEKHKTMLETLNVEIKTLRGRILDLNAILSTKDIAIRQIESSLYYKIGKFLRLI